MAAGSAGSGGGGEYNVKRLPLIITTSSRDATSLGSKDSRVFNAYLERDEFDGYTLYKRPGYALNTAFNGVHGRGTVNWMGDIYSIVDGVFYKSGTSIGNVNDNGSTYCFQAVSGATNKLFFMNGTAAYNYDASNGLVQITNISPFNFQGNISTSSTTITSISPNTTNMRVGDAISDNSGGTQIASGTTIVSVNSSTSITISSTPLANGTGTTLHDTPLSVYPTTTVRGIAYLDATVYVMDPNGNIFGSNLNDTTVWNPLNTIKAQIEPDSAVALAKQLNNVVAFKQWSTEFFYDAANTTGSPLGRIPANRLPYGCASFDSLQQIDDTLIWLTSSRAGSHQIAMLDRLSSTIISTKDVEKFFNSADTTNLMSFSFKNNGHRFYGLTDRTNNITFVYDIRERIWQQWSSGSNYFNVVGATYTPIGVVLLQSYTGGNLYNFQSTIFTDAGSDIIVDLYTPVFDDDMHLKKYLHSFEIIGDIIPGGKLAVRHTDDDYQTFSNFRYLDLSLSRPRFTQCGTFRRRAWHIQYRSNNPLRLKAIELLLRYGVL